MPHKKGGVYKDKKGKVISGEKAHKKKKQGINYDYEYIKCRDTSLEKSG